MAKDRTEELLGRMTALLYTAVRTLQTYSAKVNWTGNEDRRWCAPEPGWVNADNRLGEILGVISFSELQTAAAKGYGGPPLQSADFAGNANEERLHDAIAEQAREHRESLQLALATFCETMKQVVVGMPIVVAGEGDVVEPLMPPEQQDAAQQRISHLTQLLRICEEELAFDMGGNVFVHRGDGIVAERRECSEILARVRTALAAVGDETESNG